MKTVARIAMCASMALAVGGVAAQGTMKKDDPMSKDGMAKSMTMQECKDHMAMAAKAGTKKDDAMMKKDALCADMMKKDSAMMMKDAPKK